MYSVNFTYDQLPLGAANDIQLCQHYSDQFTGIHCVNQRPFVFKRPVARGISIIEATGQSWQVFTSPVKKKHWKETILAKMAKTHIGLFHINLILYALIV